MPQINKSGQGVLESLVTLPIMVASGLLIYHLGYRIFLYQKLDYELHEALVCTEFHPIDLCKEELLSRLHLHSIKSVSLHLYRSNERGQVKGQILVPLIPLLVIEKEYLQRHQ